MTLPKHLLWNCKAYLGIILGLDNTVYHNMSVPYQTCSPSFWRFQSHLAWTTSCKPGSKFSFELLCVHAKCLLIILRIDLSDNCFNYYLFHAVYCYKSQHLLQRYSSIFITAILKYKNSFLPILTTPFLVKNTFCDFKSLKKNHLKYWNKE